MNVVIRNPQKSDTFAALFQHIRLFTEHINVMFEKDKVFFQSMDSARVSVFELTLPSTWFDVYEHTSQSAIPIGISSSLLFKILNTRDKAQETQIKYDVDNSDKLYIGFTCDNKAIFDKNFEIPLMDIECELMGIPATESQADFSVSSANFANIINQLKLFGDTLDITCNEDKIVLQSLSTEAGKMDVEISIDELDSYSINEGETVKLSFSLNILHNICMYSKISKNVEISLIDNFPMKIVYNLGAETANLTFYLAPKISED